MTEATAKSDIGHIAFFGEQSIIGHESSRVADLPVTCLYQQVRTTVAHRRVRGLSSPWRDDPLWYAGERWLEER